MRILLVEDDELLSKTIKDTLQQNYVVDIAYNGKKALYLTEIIDYEIIILDLNLPDLMGQEILKSLRNNGNDSFILILTNNDAIETKINELNSGADDYITKPFNKKELEARIMALLRRKSSNKTNIYIYKLKKLILDNNSHSVVYANKKINLCKKEYQLLHYLFNHQGLILNHFQIFEHVWEDINEYKSNTVAVHINKLRKKIDRKFNTKLIQTVRGYGYRLIK